MGGPARLRVLGMVDGAFVMGDGLFVSFAYEWGVWSGMSSVLMYLCRVGCMIVEFGVGYFGSFLGSVSAD